MSRTAIIVAAVVAVGLLALLLVAMGVAFRNGRVQRLATDSGSGAGAASVAASGAEAGRTPPVTFQPTSSTPLQLISYPLFTIGYDAALKDPAWVVYPLDGPIAYGGPEPSRPSRYLIDENTQARVRHEDYAAGGYDRGLLCPASALFSRFGVLGRDSACIMSNAVPMAPGLRAGPWDELERRLAGRADGPAGWAATRRHLTVIAGPVFFGTSATLPSGVAIPDAIFAVVLEYVQDRQTYLALAFEFPNRERATGPLAFFLVSIEQIEEQTGLDLLAGLPTTIRGEIEEGTASELWP